MSLLLKEAEAELDADGVRKLRQYGENIAAAHEREFVDQVNSQECGMHESFEKMTLQEPSGRLREVVSAVGC